MRSFFGSTMKIASGRRYMSLMPPRKRSSSLELVGEFRDFFLGKPVEVALSAHPFELAQPRDALLDRREVRERSAEPALVDEERPGAFGLFLDGVLGLLLGADEQHDFALARHLLDGGVDLAQHHDRLLRDR